jgi:hypothetical protein
MHGFSGGAPHLDVGEVLGDGVGLQQSGQGWQPQQTRSEPWRNDMSTQLWCQAVWYTLLCPVRRIKACYRRAAERTSKLAVRLAMARASLTAKAKARARARARRSAMGWAQLAYTHRVGSNNSP